MKRALFLVNGMGLGNSTRCHAIIQQLNRRNIRCDVATYGNGLWYFDRRPEVGSLRELAPYTYGSREGELSLGRTFQEIPSLVRSHFENERRVKGWLAKERPDVVVTDSVYTFSAVRRAGIKLVSLNHSDRVLEGFQSHTHRALNLWSQLGAIEVPDFIFNLAVPDLVISPSLTEKAPGNFFLQVGPIYREKARPMPFSSKVRRVIVMLSGSSLAQPIRFSANRLPYDLVFLRKEKESLAQLQSADLIVTNAGRSSLSEILALRKPAVILPIARHAEQWVNAQALAKHGVALIGSVENLEDKIRQAAENYSKMVRAYRELEPLTNGAKEAADLISNVGKG